MILFNRIKFNETNHVIAKIGFDYHQYDVIIPHEVHSKDELEESYKNSILSMLDRFAYKEIERFISYQLESKKDITNWLFSLSQIIRYYVQLNSHSLTNLDQDIFIKVLDHIDSLVQKEDERYDMVSDNSFQKIKLNLTTKQFHFLMELLRSDNKIEVKQENHISSLIANNFYTSQTDQLSSSSINKKKNQLEEKDIDEIKILLRRMLQIINNKYK